MNHSIHSADRTTHLKIVVVALMAATALAGFSLLSHVNSDLAPTRTAIVVKAGKPVAMTSMDSSVLR